MDDKVVVVVGSGLAGLTATSVALVHGYRVILLDKNNTVGGNSAKATSGVNAANSRFQVGIDDSAFAFKEDIMKGGKYENVESLVDILAWESGSAVEYVADTWNVALSSVEYMGGASKARCHRLPPVDGKTPPVGWTIVRGAHEYVTKFEKYEERLHTKVERLVMDEDSPNRARGVMLEDGSVVNADAIILTSGGYANSESILAALNPPLTKYPTTNGWFSNGDMLTSAIEQNINVKHVDYVQLHPTSFVDLRDPGARTKFVAPEILRGVGGVLLNLQGEPITDALATRDTVSAAIIERGFTWNEALEKFGELSEMTEPVDNDKSDLRMALLVLTQESATRAGSMIGFYKTCTVMQMKGFMRDIDSELLLKTLNTESLIIKHSKYVYALVTPATHFCMGGLEIDNLGRVKMGDDSLVNVFAAGEVTGGVHGKNRLGGNGCLESLVFGRWAVMNAAAELDYGNVKSSRVISVTDIVSNANRVEVLLTKGELDNITTSVTVGSELDICSTDNVALARGKLSKLVQEGSIGVCHMTPNEIPKNLYPGREVIINTTGTCTKQHDEL